MPTAMPLSSTARSGIIAGAFVGFAFLGLLCGLGGYVYSQRGRGTEAANAASVKGKGLSTGDPKDLPAYILGHRWWSKPPTRERLDEVVRQAMELNRGSAFAFGRNGEVARSDTRVDIDKWTDFRPAHVLAGPHFIIECKWATRPDREKVLREIKVALDVQEYDDGPGR